MITYPYRCRDCRADFEVRRSITQPAGVVACPSCGSAETSQTFETVPVSFDATPRTVGAQADRNWAKAGAYERESRQQEVKQRKRRARMDASRLPPGAVSIRKPEPESPWWRPGTDRINPRLVRATGEEKRRYFEEGRI